MSVTLSFCGAARHGRIQKPCQSTPMRSNYGRGLRITAKANLNPKTNVEETARGAPRGGGAQWLRGVAETSAINRGVATLRYPEERLPPLRAVIGEPTPVENGGEITPEQKIHESRSGGLDPSRGTTRSTTQAALPPLRRRGLAHQRATARSAPNNGASTRGGVENYIDLYSSVASFGPKQCA